MALEISGMVLDYHRPCESKIVMETSLKITGDGSSTTANFPKDITKAVKGTFLYAVKYVDPGASYRPSATFNFYVRDTDNFIWSQKLNCPVDSPWVLSAYATNELLPPMLGIWNILINSTVIASGKFIYLRLYSLL